MKLTKNKPYDRLFCMLPFINIHTDKSNEIIEAITIGWMIWSVTFVREKAWLRK